MLEHYMSAPAAERADRIGIGAGLRAYDCLIDDHLCQPGWPESAGIYVGWNHQEECSVTQDAKGEPESAPHEYLPEHTGGDCIAQIRSSWTCSETFKSQF